MTVMIILVLMGSGLSISVTIGVASENIPPYLSGESETGFRRYRTKPFHRSFAYAHSGAWGFGYGFGSQKAARTKALRECKQHARTCRIIAVDNRVILEDGFSRLSNSDSTWIPNDLPLVLIGIISFVLSLGIFSYFKRYYGSTEQRQTIRTTSFEIGRSPAQILRTIEQYAEETTWLQKHEMEGRVIVLESLPGIISDGYFFRIKLTAIEQELTRLDIGCRPRIVLKLWHPFATGEINRLSKELKERFDSARNGVA
jgi:hypothetical protein